LTLSSTLADLNAAVREGRDRGEVLDRICAAVCELTGAGSAAALTLDPDGFFLVRAAAGAVTAWAPGDRVLVDDCLAGRALGKGQPVVAALHSSGYRHEQAMTSAGLRSVLYVPVPGYGSASGVLGAAFRDDRTGSGWEVPVVESLATAAGLVEEAHPDERAAGRERERLARDLHDSVVQTLYGISLGAGTAGEQLDHDPAQAQQSLHWIRETAAAGLTDVRGLILRLRPEALAGNGLTVALGRLLESPQLHRDWQTTAHLGPEPAASAEVREALYRIAQEALQNAARHADAGQVTLRLFSTGTDVVLEVVDDGRGFTLTDEFPGRLGISSMRERASAVGGRLDVVSSPGHGTVVCARLPSGSP
jgi:signal transduction histidine kinase